MADVKEYSNNERVDVGRDLKMAHIVRIASKPKFNTTNSTKARVANFCICKTHIGMSKDTITYKSAVAWGELAERMEAEGWDKGDTIDPYNFWDKQNQYMASTGMTIKEGEIHINRCNFVKKSSKSDPLPEEPKSPDAEGENQQEAE